jgi:hypothetical protein
MHPWHRMTSQIRKSEDSNKPAEKKHELRRTYFNWERLLLISTSHSWRGQVVDIVIYFFQSEIATGEKTRYIKHNWTMYPQLRWYNLHSFYNFISWWRGITQYNHKTQIHAKCWSHAKTRHWVHFIFHARVVSLGRLTDAVWEKRRCNEFYWTYKVSSDTEFLLAKGKAGMVRKWIPNTNLLCPSLLTRDIDEFLMRESDDKCAVPIFNTLCLIDIMETQLQLFGIVDTVKDFCTSLHLGDWFRICLVNKVCQWFYLLHMVSVGWWEDPSLTALLGSEMEFVSITKQIRGDRASSKNGRGSTYCICLIEILNLLWLLATKAVRFWIK